MQIKYHQLQEINIKKKLENKKKVLPLQPPLGRIPKLVQSIPIFIGRVGQEQL